ncbi:MAG: hypothetical protein ACRD02_08500 [Acidimicrobiia bacterium]
MRPLGVWAHGIGGRADLPVPLELFIYGAALVLVLSFGALAVLWPRPRLQDGVRNHRLAVPLGPAWGVLRVAGVAGLALVVVAGLIGTQGVTANIAPVTVWVVFWLVVPFAGAVAGDLWSALNPWRTLASWLGLGGEGAVSQPPRLGIWPAALVFLAFIWLELVYPDPSRPWVLAVAALAYSAYLAGWMAWSGREAGLQAADAFTVYNRLLSSLAPFGRDQRGRPIWRGWLRALPALPAWPGLAMFVVAMIGTVTYDGLSSTPLWNDLSFRLLGPASSSMWLGTAALLATVGVIGAGYLAACRAAARIAGSGVSAGRVAADFAHTLVPIALAYALAHYFTLVIFEGQLFLAALSDPLGRGWDLFGTAGWRVNFTWLPPVAVWYVQLAVIVGGHLLGVVLAHDRALAAFPARRAVRSQYAMLALMVALTGLGLTILAAG